jgi:hypothetical protein
MTLSEDSPNPTLRVKKQRSSGFKNETELEIEEGVSVY